MFHPNLPTYSVAGAVDENEKPYKRKTDIVFVNCKSACNPSFLWLYLYTSIEKYNNAKHIFEIQSILNQNIQDDYLIGILYTYSVLFT